MIIKVLLPPALIHTADDIIITARQREGERGRKGRPYLSFILFF
jgi:hypothetical protein